MLNGKDDVERVLIALSEQLAAQGAPRFEMLVCGGAALNVLEYVTRTTKDIDVIAFVEKNRELVMARPLKPELMEAARKVQRDFNLPDKWLDVGPTSLVELGLPGGLMDRVKTRRFGKKLIVHFLERYDQIHFKLLAVYYHGPERHYDDLMALKPTNKELEKAARWVLTLDPREGCRTHLKDVLCKVGFRDVSEKL